MPQGLPRQQDRHRRSAVHPCVPTNVRGKWIGCVPSSMWFRSHETIRITTTPLLARGSAAAAAGRPAACQTAVACHPGTVHRMPSASHASASRENPPSDIASARGSTSQLPPSAAWYSAGLLAPARGACDAMLTVDACVPTAAQRADRQTESPPPAESPSSRVSGSAPRTEPCRESAA